MSFDLYFYQTQDKSLPLEALKAWIKSIPNFANNADTQFWYQNKNTGVYFSLDLTSSSDPEDFPIADGFRGTGLSFNINFGRPSFFALEAMPVIDEIQGQFQLLAMNPQSEGESEVRRLSSAELVTSWTKSNECAVKALQQEDAGPRNTIPKTKTLSSWKYNYGRTALEKLSAESTTAFVPKIFYFKKRGAKNAETMFTWTDEIPTLVPQTDWVAIVRKRKKFLGADEQEVGFVRTATMMSKAKHLLSQFRSDSDYGVRIQLLSESNVRAAHKILQSIEFEQSKADSELIDSDALLEIEG